MEHRDIALVNCDLRFEGARTGQFTGYASTFGNVDSYDDTILRGAFSATLRERHSPVKMFFSHSAGRPLGVWKDIQEDDIGLKVRGEFTPGNTDAQNTYASMKHGAIDGLSIGFYIPEGGSELKKSGGRVITAVDLVEISIVSLPANTTARVVDVKTEIKSLRDAEAYLRDSGKLSRSQAVAFVSQFKTLLRSDSAGDRAEQIHELQRQLAAADVDRRVSAMIDALTIKLP